MRELFFRVFCLNKCFKLYSKTICRLERAGYNVQPCFWIQILAILFTAYCIKKLYWKDRNKEAMNGRIWKMRTRQSFQKCLFLLWTPKIFSWQDGDDAKLLILSPHFQGEIWTSQSLVGWKWNNNFEPKTFFFLSLTPSFGSLFHSFPHLQISFFQFKSISFFHTHSANTFCMSFSLPHIPHTFTNKRHICMFTLSVFLFY